MHHDIKEMLMKDAPTQFRIGNLMVTDVVSFKDIRRNYQTFYTNRERNYYAGMGFLLLNIFLGLLGTFWFRTQQRVGEIAIRKVNGATPQHIQPPDRRRPPAAGGSHHSGRSDRHGSVMV